jgi:hypothetical protein
LSTSTGLSSHPKYMVSIVYPTANQKEKYHLLVIIYRLSIRGWWLDAFFRLAFRNPDKFCQWKSIPQNFRSRSARPVRESTYPTRTLHKTVAVDKTYHYHTYNTQCLLLCVLSFTRISCCTISNFH